MEKTSEKVTILFTARLVAQRGPVCGVVLSGTRVQIRWYTVSEAPRKLEFDSKQVPRGKVAKYFEKSVKCIWNGRDQSTWNIRMHWNETQVRFLRNCAYHGRSHRNEKTALCVYIPLVLTTRLGGVHCCSMSFEDYMISEVKHTRHVTIIVSNTDLTLRGQSYRKANATLELVPTMMVRDMHCVSVGNEYSVTPSWNTDQGVHADTQAHGA